MVNVDFKNLRVVTGLVRFHYVNVFEPRESLEGGPPKYGACLIISKEDRETVDKINNAVVKVIKICQGQGMDITDLTYQNIKLPLRDGDRERADKPEFKGQYFINVTSKYKPELVDENCFMITDPKEFYSGCYGRAAVRFFPYSKGGNWGVGCSLYNVQKLEDGEELSVRISAADDFKPSMEEIVG